jgi:hypothetical protein
MRGGAEHLREQRQVIDALLALQRALEKLRPVAYERTSDAAS